MMLKNKGFTLIELVIVIIVLSALGIATSSYISTGVSIYTDITERDKELNSVRFVMERLRREVANALPNSLALDNNQCLTFRPIHKSTVYGFDFPIAPLTASSGDIASIENYTFAADDKAVIYLLDKVELDESRQVHTISAVNNERITFSSVVSFDLGSPSKRLYIIRDKLKYCFSGGDLERTFNDDQPVLMANDIQGEFTVVNATLQRNGLAKVRFTLNFDGQEVPIEQTLHVNNVP